MCLFRENLGHLDTQHLSLFAYLFCDIFLASVLVSGVQVILDNPDY